MNVNDEFSLVELKNNNISDNLTFLVEIMIEKVVSRML